MITLNGEVIEVVPNLLLSEILDKYALLDSKGIAVAINEEVVPREKWSQTNVLDNDKILIIKATQGG